MFAKLLNFVAASAVVVGVVSTPLPQRVRDLVARDGSYSFNNWEGHSSLSGFDNFYGSDNFRGSISHVTVIQETEEEVCRSQDVRIIQQRLLVLQEMAKRIISEQICDVETQVIVFEQFHSSMSSFSDDLRRNSGRDVGYDHGISSHYDNIMNSDGSLSDNDLGFSGSDLGNQYVTPSGSNWNDQSSRSSVESAYQASHSAGKKSSKGKKSSSGGNSSSGSSSSDSSSKGKQSNNGSSSSSSSDGKHDVSSSAIASSTAEATSAAATNTADASSTAYASSTSSAYTSAASATATA